MKDRVVVGFCREVSMVHAISTLIQQGFEVVAFDALSYAPGLRVRGLKNAFSNPEIMKDEDVYIDFLQKISSSLPDAILLTGDDYTSYIICKHKEHLQQYYRFLSPDYATYQRVVDKYLLSNLLKESRLNSIPTFTFEMLDPQRLKYPVMIKPKIGAGGRRQLKCLSPAEVETFIESNHKILNDFFIQEYIPGPITNLYTVNLIMNQQSNPVCAFSANRLSVFTSSQIPEGVTTFIRSVRLDELIRDCIRFMEKLNWVGIAELEFKKDSNDSKFKLLEINPRLWSWTKLATMSGVNFPLHYVTALSNEASKEKLPLFSDFQEGVYYLRLMSDQYANLVRLMRGELSIRGFLNQIYQRAKQLISGKLVIDRFESIRWLYCHLRQKKEYI